VSACTNVYACVNFTSKMAGNGASDDVRESLTHSRCQSELAEKPLALMFHTATEESRHVIAEIETLGRSYFRANSRNLQL
jgi:hypothetical protein